MMEVVAHICNKFAHLGRFLLFAMDSVLPYCGVECPKDVSASNLQAAAITDLLESKEQDFSVDSYHNITQDECLMHAVRLGGRQLGIDLVAEGLDNANELKPSDLTYLQIEQITGGITNLLYRVKNTKNGAFVLVRLFGEDTDYTRRACNIPTGPKTSHIIDRKREYIICSELSIYGFCKAIYGLFNGGQVEEYIPGKTLDSSQMLSGEANAIIAKNLCKLHKFPNALRLYNKLFPQEPVENVAHFKSSLWTKVDQFYKICTGAQDQIVKMSSMNFDFTRIEPAIPNVRRACIEAKSRITLCHADLHADNLVVEALGGAVKFIDFEYSNFMERGFDISNHFMEYAGFDCIWSQLPDEERIFDFLTAYLEEDLQREPTKEEIAALRLEIVPFVPAAHLFWGLWAIIQASNSTIDFNFIHYACQRLEQFLKTAQKVQVNNEAAV